MKSLILASVAAAVMAFAMPTAVDAAKVKIYLGQPHYDYRVGPGWRFREGYGWYDPVVIYDRGYVRGRISCGEARRIVRNSGFRNVDTVECNGRTYTFEATRRGRDVTVFVNSRNGRIWRG
jgi:hypothetical protein